MVSCLEPEDFAQALGSPEMSNSVFCLAPSQGCQPVTVFDMESQAFPYLFPTAKNTFSQTRNTKLGINRYFNARLFSADIRFASDPQYIFYSQYVSELNAINSSVSIAMRKGSSTTFNQQHLTATQLRDPNTRKQILSTDAGYHFLSTARGSPPYWEKTLKDLFAMVRQLGIPTWFCSFSAADRRWPEIITAICTQQGRPVPEDLDWSTYCNLINSNPVTACRIFQNRVLTFITDLILCAAKPIGEVSDFFYRTEFQSRGWPHIHCLFWCSDAPLFDPSSNNNQDYINYIDKYISCSLPDKDTDPELFEIVTSVQLHSKRHSKTCKKGNKECRFGFPRPVSLNTFIAIPSEGPENISPAAFKKAALNTLSSVWNMIKTYQEQDTNMTVSDLFAKLDITPDDYVAAHCALAQKNTVIYKRNMPECWINPYNSHLLRAWNGNMDIQPVLDAYSCIMYIVSYISKAERELGDLLRNAQTEAKEGHLEPMQQLRKLGNVYLHSREVSIMEAVYRVTGMHLKQSSRQVVFIPVDRRSSKITKPLKSLTEDDENIWMTSLIDRYLARPSSPIFEQMSLAEFTRDYCVKQRTSDNTDDSSSNTEQTECKVYLLQNNMGTIAKRQKPAIIRYMKVSKDKNTEDYYHNLLRLYMPHRCKELTPVNTHSYEEMFNEQSAVLLPLISQFEKLSTDLDQAWKSLQEQGFTEDAWADIAPNQEPQRLEEDEELQNALKQFRAESDQIPEEDIPDFSPNQTSATSTYQIHSQDVNTSNSAIQQRERLKNMNHQQAEIFHFIKTWTQMKENGEAVKPFYIFLTGGAGTGKSFTIKCIYHELNKTLSRQSGNPDLPVVLLLSYTGTAAFNINGQTIHSAFAINRGMSKVLPEESANTLRSNLQDLQLLIIDEISMVPLDLLNLIHCRLQQIKQPFSPSTYFGNVSILAVGDFYQVPPVAKKSLLSNNTSLTDLWGLFHIWQLSEVVRQKGDQQFIALLNRLRVRKKKQPLSTEDEQFLNKHVICKTDATYPHDALHIAPLHRQLREHNHFMLTKLSSTETLYDLEAADMCHDSKTQQTFKRKEPLPVQGTNLPANLTVCCGARVILTMNIDVTDGLTNGAIGTITSIVTKNSPLGLPDAICVLFTEERVGLKSRHSHRPPPNIPSSTVILPQTEVIQRKPFQVTRHQYPLMLAWAVTIHKIQGATTNKAVVSLDGAFKPGMAYVALSRVTSSSGMYLLKDHFNPDAIYCDEAIEDKLSNMPKANILPGWNTLMPKNQFNHQNYIYIASHNCEGLIPNLQEICSNSFLQQMDIIALQETWLNPQISFTNPFPLYRQFLCNRQIQTSGNLVQQGKHNKGGVALYVHNDFSCTPVDTTDIPIECLAIELTDISTCVYCVYRPPKQPLSYFTNQLTKLLKKTTCEKVILTGDFNVNILRASNKDLNICLQNYVQIINSPTTAKRTLIDHIYIKNIIYSESGVIPTHYSYHDITYAIICMPENSKNE